MLGRFALLLRSLCLSAILGPTLVAAQSLAPAAPTARPQLSDALALALGQKKPEMSLGVAAIVNDYVISDYDLDQRVAWSARSPRPEAGCRGARDREERGQALQAPPRSGSSLRAWAQRPAVSAQGRSSRDRKSTRLNSSH